MLINLKEMSLHSFCFSVSGGVRCTEKRPSASHKNIGSFFERNRLGKFWSWDIGSLFNISVIKGLSLDEKQ